MGATSIVKLLLYGFSHDTELKDEPVTVDQALGLLDSQQTLQEERDNYIGFQIPGMENCIQFYREDAINWVIDLPVYRNDEYQYSKAGRTSMRMVRDIVSRLFDPKSRLDNSLRNSDYSGVEDISDYVWKIQMELVE